MANESSGEPRPGYGDGSTWTQRDLPIARRLAGPLRSFLHVEAGGGIVLLLATIAALILANTAYGPGISAFWDEDLTLFEFGDLHLTESIGHWINDGLMAIFFFVVGLEIKREIVTGELRDPRRAALPAMAAVGGMVVPAVLYAVVTVGGDGSGGWGIPMATDIAFAVGVMAILGPRVPSSLKVFVLTLAIVDDIGAILVIAIFYSEQISGGWLGIAAGLLGAIVVLRLVRVWYIPVYVVLGVGVWIAFLESGVHATIAGVVLGLLTPARPLRPDPTPIALGPDPSYGSLQRTVFDAKESFPVAERLQNAIHPWSAYLILPLFAFSNAGIVLTGQAMSDAARSPIAIGVVLGLVIGKPLGIVAASWLSVRLRIGELPVDMSWGSVVGAGALAGIGFTVSLFIAGLAFSAPDLAQESKIGILFASVLAGLLGAGLLYRAGSAHAPDVAA